METVNIIFQAVLNSSVIWFRKEALLKVNNNLKIVILILLLKEVLPNEIDSGSLELCFSIFFSKLLSTRSFLGVGSNKWAEKFCQKFIDNLNMRSLIASLVLSVMLLNFDAFGMS